jgi:hypothetical protein
MRGLAPHRSLTRKPRSAVRGGLACALIAISLLGTNGSAALADADPASDVLLAQNAFYPYQPPVSPKLEAAMNSALSAAARVWLPLKVAIIGSPEDLGAVPEFFGHPQPYANFLDREISFNSPLPLLVVMAAGYGHAAIGRTSALAGLPIDARQGSYGLTRSAILAVVALARAAGHPISTPSIPSSAGTAHDAVSGTLLYLTPIALLMLAGIVGIRRGRRRRPHVSPPPEFFGA